MDVILLSRLQFALTIIFHFFFVPLTLGLSILIAWMETRYVMSGDELYRRMARFWGKLFLINFAVGVVTGITLEFQFGTNWAEYSRYVGDVFGSLLAIEATVAFFLESTFIAVWHFGWKRLTPKAHAAAIWVVAAASNISAIWIVAANSWMQDPVGYVIRNGRAELSDFGALLTHPYFFGQLIHTLSSAYLLAGFFVMGVSAWHLLRGNEQGFFNRSFRMALVFSFVCALVVAGGGHFHGETVADTQPEKIAAMTSHWETGVNVPMSLIIWPDAANERNAVSALKIPGLLSFITQRDFHAEVKGLLDFPPDERPPVLLTFLSFHAMVGLGFLFPLLTVIGLLIRKRLESFPLYLRIMILSIPLPYLAIQFGWIVAEVGRQPWIVYRVMRTADAVSPIQASQVLFSAVALIGIYVIIGFAALYLVIKHAAAGPEPAPGTEGGAG